MAQIKEDECPKGLPGWLATFGDLMSLLLTFFVLMLSFSTMEVIKFNHAMGSLRGSLGVFTTDPEMSQPIRITMPLARGKVRQSENIRKASEALQKTLSDEGMEGDVTLTANSSGLVIRIQTPILYELNSADIKGEVKDILLRIGEILKLLPNETLVQGHTDNLPINRGPYPSNWELSYQRAVNVVRYLITEGRLVPTRIAAEGYGKFRPILPNTTAKGRAQNRRIEIHIIYAGEVDGNLEIIADTFRNYGISGTQKDGERIQN